MPNKKTTCLVKKDESESALDSEQNQALEGFTLKQSNFVREFVGGKYAGNGAKSAIAAGYSAKSADMIACALAKHPKIAAAIDAALRAEIGGKLTAQAVSVIRTILADENAPLRLRGDMACKVVEFSGIVERVRLEKASETGLDGASAGPKRLAEYTRDELETLVRNGAALLQAAAALPPVSSDSPELSLTIPTKGHASLMISKA